MSLSPLSPIETSDLHVSTVGDLPSKFPSTSAKSGLAQHLSGPIIHTLTPKLRSPLLEVYVFSLWDRSTLRLTCMYDRLLGPCFKTGRKLNGATRHTPGVMTVHD